MSIEATYHGEVRFVRSSFTSKNGATVVLALPDIAELERVQGMDGKRYMLALVEIGDDETPVQKPQAVEKPKGGPLAILAGKWCQEPEFWKFLNGTFHSADTVTNGREAAELVRYLCICVSRAELDHSETSAANFHRLIRGPYIKWMAARGVRFTAPEYETA